jgi:hypothetical protein
MTRYKCKSPYGNFEIIYKVTGDCEILFEDLTFYDKRECKELLKLKGEEVPEDVHFLKQLFRGTLSIN